MLTRIVGHHVQIFKVGEATLDLPTYTTACQSHDECRDSEWDRIPTQRQHTMKKIFRQPTGEYCTLSKRCSRKKVNTSEKSLSYSLFCDKAIKWFPISFFLPQKMFPFRMRKGRKQMFSNPYFSSFVFPGRKFVVLWGCGVRFREVFRLQLHFFGGRDRQYQPWQTWHKDMI